MFLLSDYMCSPLADYVPFLQGVRLVKPIYNHAESYQKIDGQSKCAFYFADYMQVLQILLVNLMYNHVELSQKI